MNVIKYKWVFLGFSTLLILASIFGLIAFGLQRGIDFTGGTLWQVKFDKQVTQEALVGFLHKDLNLPEAAVSGQQDGGSEGQSEQQRHELSHHGLLSRYGVA